MSRHCHGCMGWSLARLSHATSWWGSLDLGRKSNGRSSTFKPKSVGQLTETVWNCCENCVHLRSYQRSVGGEKQIFQPVPPGSFAVTPMCSFRVDLHGCAWRRQTPPDLPKNLRTSQTLQSSFEGLCLASSPHFSSTRGVL